jgi:ADP-ribosylglycohydrolase
LARELLQSYVACRRFDPADYAQRIAAIFREQRIVGAGGAAKFAAGRLNAGVPWEEAGMPPPDARNGSAMRAGPIGLLFHDDPSALIRAAHDQGRITHQDPRCSAGAAAIAGAVALALRGGAITPGPFLAELATWTATIEPTTPSYLQQLIEWVTLPPAEAAPFIAVAGQDPTSLGGEIRIPVFVTSSILWSLYAFLRTPGDYWETICTAIAVGGDVDTTAAMAGAISGAYLGLEAIPTHLASRLSDQGTWGLSELVGLADDAHAIAKG